jgi:hypothetical protein
MELRTECSAAEDNSGKGSHEGEELRRRDYNAAILTLLPGWPIARRAVSRMGRQRRSRRRWPDQHARVYRRHRLRRAGHRHRRGRAGQTLLPDRHSIIRPQVSLLPAVPVHSFAPSLTREMKHSEAKCSERGFQGLSAGHLHNHFSFGPALFQINQGFLRLFEREDLVDHRPDFFRREKFADFRKLSAVRMHEEE